MWPLTLALLLANPAVTEDERPIQVVVNGAAEDPHLAHDVAAAIEHVGLEAESAELAAFLEARPDGCRDDVACLCLAPTISDADEVVVLRVTSFERGLRGVDLRLLDCTNSTQRARVSEVVDAKEVVAWFGKTARRLVLLKQ